MFQLLIARLRQRFAKPASMAASGVRTESDAAYRRQRMDFFARQMADRSPAKVRELEEFLDQWMVLPVTTDQGDEWLAFPGWDDEPLLTRNTYPTYDEAVTAVAAVGGDLRVCRRA